MSANLWLTSIDKSRDLRDKLGHKVDPSMLAKSLDRFHKGRAVLFHRVDQEQRC